MIQYALPSMDWRTLYVAPMLLRVEYDEGLMFDFDN